MAFQQSRDDGGYGSEMAGENGPGRGVAAPVSRWVQLAGAATSVALVLGVVVWGYKLAVRDVSGVPIIRAMQGPGRIAPEDPGGNLAAHVGLAVNEVAGTGLAAPGPERVVLAPATGGLSPDDAPMSALRPLPAPAARPAAAPSAAAPANPPVPDRDAAPATGVSATAPDPATADPVAAAEAETAVAATVVAPDAGAAATAAAVVRPDPDALPEGAIPRSVPGVTRSPRPLARPDRDLVAEAAVRDVTISLGGSPDENIEIDPASLPDGTRVVQLGAFDSPDLARAEWDKVAARFEPLMEGKKRIVQEAASGGRSFWRLRVQGFESVEDARRFCAALVAEGANCIPTLAK